MVSILQKEGVDFLQVKCLLQQLLISFQKQLFSNKVCWEFGSFRIAPLHAHVLRLLHKKFIVLYAITVASIGHLEAAFVGKQLL